jgi:hypothetical protein
MKRTVRSVAFLAGLAGLLFSILPSQAATTLPGIILEPSRFSGPGVYTGKPALPVTLSMVIAGGGPADFQATKLVGVLAGPLTNAEVAKLNTQFGPDKVKSFLTTFNFVVADTLRLVKVNHITLPTTPNPDPTDGKALSAALWGAGQTGQGFNVEVMLDRAVSHPLHVQVMKDIDARYGLAADATYHAVLTAAMHDLATAYHLSS